MDKLIYKYSIKDCIICGKKEILLVIFIILDMGLFVYLCCMGVIGRFGIMGMVLNVLSFIEVFPFVYKMFSDQKKTEIEEYDAIVCGITNEDKIIFRYCKNGNIMSKKLYAPCVKKEAIDDLISEGGQCHIKLNVKTQVLLDLNRTDNKIDFPAVKKCKKIINSLVYEDILYEPVYAYFGCLSVVLFIIVGLLFMYFEIAWGVKMCFYAGCSMILYVLLDYRDELKSVGDSLKVKKMKGKKSLSVVGNFVYFYCPGNFYSKLRKEVHRDFVKILLKDSNNNWMKFNAYIDKKNIWDFISLETADRKVKICYYEGTNIVKKIETID